MPRSNTALRQAYREFFTALVSQVRQQVPQFNLRAKVQARNYYNFSFRVGGIHYAAGFPDKSTLAVGIWLETRSHDRNKAIFDELQRNKSDIEKEIGAKLQWRRQDNKQRSSVVIERMGSIASSPEELQDLQEWAVDYLGRFDKTFRTRVISLVRDH